MWHDWRHFADFGLSSVRPDHPIGFNASTSSWWPSHSTSINSTTRHWSATWYYSRRSILTLPSSYISSLDKSQPLSSTNLARTRAPLELGPSHNPTIRVYVDVWCATFSPDGKHIISGSGDGGLGAIQIWNAQTGSCALGPMKTQTSIVRCIACSPDSRQIVLGSDDKKITVCDALIGTIVSGPFHGHTRAISSVTFSPDGSMIASGSRDRTVRLWDARTGINILGPLKGHTDDVVSLVFSGDGKQIVTGSDDNTIKVWDTRSGRIIWGSLRGHKHCVSFVAFSPDAKQIVSVDWGRDVCVRGARRGNLVSGPSKRHKAGTLAVAFTASSAPYTFAVSPDGKWIAGMNMSTIQVWDSKTGQLTAVLEGHTDVVLSASFSPDSKQILSTSKDKTVRVHTLDCQPSDT
jgi:WD40 repeat protein